MVDLPFPRVSATAGPDAAVRPALPSDAADVTDVQLAVWRRHYSGVLPESAFGAGMRADMAAHWADSLSRPPSVLNSAFVATSGRVVVGYALTAPADDGDGTGEVTDLEVQPDATRLGHGSRLLAAAVEHLRDHGSTAVVVWCGEADPARREFLESAGLVADGGRRRLDTGEGSPGVEQLRLSARLD